MNWEGICFIGMVQRQQVWRPKVLGPWKVASSSGSKGSIGATKARWSYDMHRER